MIDSRPAIPNIIHLPFKCWIFQIFERFFIPISVHFLERGNLLVFGQISYLSDIREKAYKSAKILIIRYGQAPWQVNDRPRGICPPAKCAKTAAGQSAPRGTIRRWQTGAGTALGKNGLKLWLIFNPCENSEQNAQIMSQSIQNSTALIRE